MSPQTRLAMMIAAMVLMLGVPACMLATKSLRAQDLEKAVLSGAIIPEDVVRAAMRDVERVLIAEGYNVKGFANGPAPATYYYDASMWPGLWGAYNGESIGISTTQPTDCVPLTLRHELTHHAQRMFPYIMIPKTVPIAQLRDYREAQARWIETKFVLSPYLPGCVKMKARRP